MIRKGKTAKEFEIEERIKKYKSQEYLFKIQIDALEEANDYLEKKVESLDHQVRYLSNELCSDKHIRVRLPKFLVKFLRYMNSVETDY